MYVDERKLAKKELYEKKTDEKRDNMRLYQKKLMNWRCATYDGRMAIDIHLHHLPSNSCCNTFHIQLKIGDSSPG